VATVQAERSAAEAEHAGLKANAIGFFDALVIGLASTAPAYSLAAVMGTLAVVVGVQAPAALLASFVPMFFIAAAFYYMNRADPDAGTTFSWVTRSLGPYPGWIGGWAVCVTGILVVGSLADVGARYTYVFFGWDGAAGSKPAITALAVAYIIVLTAVCVIGTELSARVQNVMILAQVGALLLLAAFALGKVWAGDATPESIEPSLSWFNPFAIDSGDALISALLIGVFIYWGWESAVNLAEETKDSRTASGLAALTSTLILVFTYVAVATAVVAYAGVALLEEFDDDDALFGTIANGVLGSPWDKIVILAIVTSAIASTQTTIIPASRTSFSMARSHALPRGLASIHPRFQTPHVSTIVVAALAVAWYVPANFISENFLFDTLSALALMIAFYYALSGLACVVYYRRELTKSVSNLLFIGVAPLIGAALLAFLFFQSVRDFTDPGASYTGQSILGVGVPLVIGVGFLLLGVVFMILWRLGGHERFFGRKPLEAVDPDVAAGRVLVAETSGLDDEKRED
jgi:amino acid transporter